MDRFFVLWLVAAAVMVSVQAVASWHIHHYLAQNRTERSPYRPKLSDAELFQANSFGYVFGFVFRDGLSFWGFACSVLRGEVMRPIRRWMWVWLVGLVGLLPVGAWLFYHIMQLG